jgi:hypothetical protein
MNISTIPFEPDSSYIAEGVMSLNEVMHGASVTNHNLNITTDEAGDVLTFHEGGSLSKPEFANMWDYRKVRNLQTGAAWDLRLHTAAVIDSIELAEEALAEGADIHFRIKQGSTALHWAAALGRGDLAALLVNHGADLNAVDELGWTPDRLAAKQGFRAVAEFLAGASSQSPAQ